MKTLTSELRELWRSTVRARPVGTSPWEKTLAAVAAASGGTCTPRLLGLDVRATVREMPVVARLRFRGGPVLLLSAQAGSPVPLTVRVARRSAAASLALRVTKRAPPVLVGDGAFDAAFSVEAHSSRVAESLLDTALRRALFELGRFARLSYDAGDVTVAWRTFSDETSSFDVGLDALTRAVAWRFQDAPYR